MKIITLIMLIFIFLMPVTDVALQEKSTKSEDSPSTDEAVEDQSDSLLYTRPDYIYETLGRRDPFESLVPEEKDEGEKIIKGLFIYEEAQILGIVNSEQDLYALLMDENAASYVLREGERVFGGYVSQITDDAVYLHIVKYGRSMTIIMRLESSKLTVIEERDGEISVKKPGIDISYEKGVLGPEEFIIEEVSVPSPYIKTIEEEWSDAKEETQNLLNEDSIYTQTESDSFYLIDPNDNSWIRLPYLLGWTKAAGEDISYSLVIDDDLDFESPIFIKEGINTLSYLLDDEMKLPPNKELFWKVIAIEPSEKRLYSKQTDMSFRIIGQK